MSRREAGSTTLSAQLDGLIVSSTLSHRKAAQVATTSWKECSATANKIGKRKRMLRSAVAIVVIVLCSSPVKGAVRTAVWGQTSSGEPVNIYSLDNDHLTVRITEYGARIVSIQAPDRDGKRADVVLGYDSLAQYLENPETYFGAIVGRYGNRIAKGNFSLEGTTYQIPPNNKGNALHGGPRGFSSKVWRGKVVGTNAVEFTLVSPDGDMGFPGALTIHVRYTLSANRLQIRYRARTTRSTVVNLTNHSYFNLAGESSGNILRQELRIDADSITAVDASLIPTGVVTKVQGTPFEFNSLTSIGKRIGIEDEQLGYAGGYDHNFVLTGKRGTLHDAAYALDPASGRTLTVLTTEPGLQFYSGNFLDGTLRGFSGAIYAKHAGFCLETQHFPDSPNHANFPSTELKAGSEYRSETVFVFGQSGKAD
jgi:aldose 1-epimerase